MKSEGFGKWAKDPGVVKWQSWDSEPTVFVTAGYDPFQ